MRKLLVYLASSLVLSTAFAYPASAQQVAERMSCDAVISQFARSGVIYKTVNGQVLPMRQGVPVAKQNTVRCGGNGSTLRPMSVKTTDKSRCVYAVMCQ